MKSLQLNENVSGALWIIFMKGDSQRILGKQGDEMKKRIFDER
jgi:hypothetical protein